MTVLAGVRSVAAIWLAGLVLALSAAPCAEPATLSPRAAATSHDPCGGRSAAPVVACVQLACQLVIAPSALSVPTPAPCVSETFLILRHDRSGLAVAPIDPPPRAPVNERA